GIHRSKAFRDAVDFGVRRSGAVAGGDRRLWRCQSLGSQSHAGDRTQDGAGRFAARRDALGLRAWITSRVYRTLRGTARRRGRRDVTAQPAVRRRANRPAFTGCGRAHSPVRVLAGVLSPRAARGGTESGGFAQELVTSVERSASLCPLQEGKVMKKSIASNQFAGLILGILLGCCILSPPIATTARAQSADRIVKNEPLPDLNALLARLRENQQALEQLREKYAYTETTTQYQLDKQGAAQEKGSETREMTIYRGHRVWRTIAKNGQPLSAKDQAKEDRRFEKMIRDLDSGRWTPPPDNQRRGKEAAPWPRPRLPNPRDQQCCEP